MFATLFDGSELEVFSFTVLDPSLGRFLDGDASAERRVSPLSDFVSSYDRPGLRFPFCPEGAESTSARIVRVVKYPSGMVGTGRLPGALTNRHVTFHWGLRNSVRA